MIIIGLFFLFLFGITLGKRFFAQEGLFWYSGFGLLLTLAGVGIVGSFAYYMFALTNGVIIGIVIVMVVLLILWKNNLRLALFELWEAARVQIIFFRTTPVFLLLVGVFLIAIASAFVLLARHQTLDAVRSVWEVIPPAFFVAYGVAVLSGLIMLANRRLPFFVLFCLTFLALSVAWIVFPIGYGFDSFIHGATEKAIAASGSITPKPLYYVGQYALVVFLAKISGVSVVWVDKLLVPLLAAFFIPWSILIWSKRNEGTRHRLPMIGYLLLPFFLAPFTITTPQALGNLYLVVLIFLTTHNSQLITRVIFASAALLTHPLAGIPAFIFIIISYLQNNRHRWFQVMSYVFCVITVPLAFLFASLVSSQIHISFTPQNFFSWLSSLEWGGVYRENRFNAFFDIIYFYGFNIKNIFWFFVLTTVILWYRKKWSDVSGFTESPRRGRDSGQWSIVIQGFAILLINYVILRGFLSFDFLIGYEQTDYARRLLDIAHLFLLPFFLLGISWWVERIAWRGTLARGLILTVVLFMTTASLFLTYPQRVDRYAVNHGFNTSRVDIEAVRWIDADAKGENYIVLANQAVSAAAMREFGFKKYYGASYFYPIPTGSPLYQDYLDMVYKKPSPEILERAMDRVGVRKSYFVLNSYWTDAETIKTEAEATLKRVYAVDNDVYIFTRR